MENEAEIYDIWNEEKKRIESLQVDILPKERQVRICILGKNIGREQNGSPETFSRPVLVIKKFNRDMFWVIPLSTKQKDFNTYYNFTDPHGRGASAIMSQLRVVSVKRFQRYLYTMPKQIYTEIFWKFVCLLFSSVS